MRAKIIRKKMQKTVLKQGVQINTREDLYKLQRIVLGQMNANPATYAYELKKIKDYDQTEIDIILTILSSKREGRS